jgi:threonine synthase
MTTAACASTGNLAQSVAAHSAGAGLDACVLIPSNLEEAKVMATAVYGARLVAVEGNYDDVNRLCGEIASEHADWGFVNVNLRPYYAEGSKTIGFEIAEQLGWQLPDHVVAPMASGSMLVKIDKAFREFTELGLVDGAGWKISGAQATGCSPIAAAFKSGVDAIRPVRPDTVAKSLAIGDPADGYYALDVVHRTGGAMEDVSDAEIADAILLLARTEGIFAETAGGVTVAVLAKLAAAGRIDAAERTVAVISGHGLKTLPVLAGRAIPTHTIPATLDAFHAALGLQEVSA